ncbi:MAG: hypothetical protein FWG20_06430, partial [Candidatus Cloacimonetes bacterium]|nr:hypothetical protein [Candidatus Cloacimonadota bacterium]
MTDQICEKLLYKGKKHDIDSLPLKPYLSLLDIHFEDTCSAMIRGYQGQWEITDGKLYLVGFAGGVRYEHKKVEIASYIENHQGKVVFSTETKKDIEISLKQLFPGHQKVFADWFTGKIWLLGTEIVLKIKNGV